VPEALWRTTPVEVGDSGVGDEVERVWASDRVVVVIARCVWSPCVADDTWCAACPV
jgi:hypothetical protein